ncbi:hypothetical protein [Alkalilacustris brevis]|uniref:hypothetical protein n=1 Tax=Alkalilacustris brevis TaxID=2026338 RepID=UPI000E0D2623|nr:hypothetical protein [Alkalilacustris brevis]
MSKAPHPSSAPTAPLPGDHGGGRGLRGTDMVAIGLAVMWLLAVGLYFLLAPPAPEGGGGMAGIVTLVLTLLAVFLPIALIWIAATTARTAREMREEAARLQAAIDAMRNAYIAQNQGVRQELSPAVERKLEELAAAQRKTESAIATFATRRDQAQVVPSADHKTALALPPEPEAAEAQPALALGTPTEDLRTPVSLTDFLRALNFPETPEDKAGFRALRLALEDPRAARLIRAAQDVLTLLSEDGIYMDDLKPDRARPELWRRFAQGARGGEVAGLGGVRDRSCLALAAARMREDTVFRDAAHHFLRQFDQMLEEFEANASDLELARLADTRSARAFMLLGRVTGIFD